MALQTGMTGLKVPPHKHVHYLKDSLQQLRVIRIDE
jgi:hypothetical protein